MSNPFEFREVMKASMRFNETRTVEEVIASHEARTEERRDSRLRKRGVTPHARPAKRGSKARKRKAAGLTPPSAVQLAALDKLVDRAKMLRAGKEQ